jgi:hypothetical protein
MKPRPSRQQSDPELELVAMVVAGSQDVLGGQLAEVKRLASWALRRER